MNRLHGFDRVLVLANGKESTRKFESGQVAVLAAGAMVLMIGFAALVVDVGFLYATRRNMQTAADAAAVAGANALLNGATCAAGDCPAATDVATLNGYTGGVNGATVTVGPPATPPNPADGNYVQVAVSEGVPTFFMSALGFPMVKVAATAVAGYVSTSTCVVAFDQTAQNALVVSGSGDLTATNCNVAIDSDSTNGLVVSGSGILAGSVGVAASSESQADVASSPGSPGVSPGYVTNMANVPDPLANQAPPAPCASGGGCTATCNTLTTARKGLTVSSSQTISAGVYCGGITVNKPATLTVGPGNYILLGGGLTVQGGGTITDNGAGVTFYNTYPTGSPNQYNTINITGGSTANLSAPVSGSTSGIPGILFFQDRSSGGSNPQNQKNVISASNGTLSGALYFPTQNLVFSGNTSVSIANVSLMADTITISGAANVGTGGSGPAETTGIATSKLYE